MSAPMTYRNLYNGEVETYFQTLLRYRHLFLNLIGADLRARFRRRYLGIFWAMLQPIGFALVIAYVWHLLFHHELSYFALHVMSGLIIWEFFTDSINRGLHALEHGAGYLKQTRVPFFILQARVPFTEAVAFLFGLAGFFIMQIGFGVAPPLSPSILLLIPYVAIMILLCVPISMICSIFGAQFRDLQHITSMALRALFFCSPILAERELFNTPALHFMHWLNPVLPLCDLFRDPAIKGVWWDPFDLLVILGWSALLWAIALIVAAVNGRRVVYSI
jgi:ABC-type polysaccharide/polyol phosphate export permease